MVLAIDDQKYAIAATSVRSIIELESLTYVPGAPDGVVGVLNLRGDVIPVIEFAPDDAAEEEHAIALVLEVPEGEEQFEVALTIDEVLTVTREELRRQEVDDVVREDARVVDMVLLDGGPVLVLDVAKLVDGGSEVIV